MYSTSKMIGKINFNEKLHKYLHSLASRPGFQAKNVFSIYVDNWCILCKSKQSNHISLEYIVRYMETWSKINQYQCKLTIGSFM